MGDDIARRRSARSTRPRDGTSPASPGRGQHRGARPARPPSAVQGTRPSILLATALEMARLANAALAQAGFAQATVVGAARRGEEVVSGLTMIVPGPCDPRALAQALERAYACRSAMLDGDGAIQLRFDGGGPAVVRAVTHEQFVETLLRETGSSSHFAWLEARATRLGGLAAVCARADDEPALYESLGLPFAPPEWRRGPTPRVPELVREVRGIFHVHTSWSDGSGSIVEMARAAADAGFAYLGISDHSRAAVYARGLDDRRLRQQARALDEARHVVPEVLLFHGVEVDVLADGSLDLEDATLARLDFVVASIHESMAMSRSDMTARLVRAVSHPLVTILGHPTGRLLLGRKGSDFDLDAVAIAAAAHGTLLEINANPNRLDLSDTLVRRAAALGARFAIDPDAHTPTAVRDTSLGVTVARRAGLGPSRVLNAAGPVEVSAYLAARRGVMAV